MRAVGCDHDCGEVVARGLGTLWRVRLGGYEHAQFQFLAGV